MRGLTLTQPWATLMAIGAKTIETRNWSTNYRGPVAIHAAKGFPVEAQFLCYENPFYEILMSAGYPILGGMGTVQCLPRGVIIAVADLISVERADETERALQTEMDNELPEITRRAQNELIFGNYEPGRFAWHFQVHDPLQQPIPCRGMLGLWTVPNEIVKQIGVQDDN